MGKVHEYLLGIVFDFRKERSLQVTMYEYINGLLKEANKQGISGISEIPAGPNLYKVNKDKPKLGEEEKEKEWFHYITVKLLFLSKQTHPDIMTAIAFLSTQVWEPDEDDKTKLSIVRQCLRGMRGLPLIIKTDDTKSARW